MNETPTGGPVKMHFNRHLTVRLTDSQFEKIDAFAVQRHLKRSVAARIVIRLGLALQKHCEISDKGTEKHSPEADDQPAEGERTLTVRVAAGDFEQIKAIAYKYHVERSGAARQVIEYALNGGYELIPEIRRGSQNVESQNFCP